MIEDEKLRNLFKVESEEHLQQLDAGLLTLEENPDDEIVLAKVYREMHSIKGSARMLGVETVEKIAHRIEDLLGKAKEGEIELSSRLFDLFYRGVDTVRILVQEAVTGTPAHIDFQNTLKELKIEDNFEEPSLIKGTEKEETRVLSISKNLVQSEDGKSTGRPLKDNEVNGEKEPLPHPAQEDAPLTAEVTRDNNSDESSRKYHIDTVRVDTRLLDNLITQVGELNVTKTRVSRQLLEIENIISLLEEREKRNYQNRFLFQDIEKSSGNATHATLSKLFEIQDDQRYFLDHLSGLLEKFKNTGYEDSARLDYLSMKLDEGVRKIRLVPLSTIFNVFPRTVRDLSKKHGKEINLIIEGGDTSADKRIVEEIKDPLMHIIRNAIDHGIEAPDERERLGKPRPGTILLKAYQTSTSIMIEVSDDGRGVDIESVRRTALKREVCSDDELAKMTKEQIQELIFRAGFSTSNFVTDISGRGIGLDVVNANVENLKGKIKVESSSGSGCKFQLSLPFTLATVRALITLVNQVSYATPLEYIETSISVKRSDIYPIEGRETVSYNGNPISVVRLADLLELKVDRKEEPEVMPCVIIFVGDKKLGLLVDSLVDEQEIVLKPQCFILQRVRNVSGSTVLGTGEVCKLLNPLDLIKSLKKSNPFTVSEDEEDAAPARKVLLLAEDSITTRTQEKRILEMGGYEVVTAVDGLDAYNKLNTREFDGIVSDVEMPNLDGLGFTKKVRENKKYKGLPVILVTSLSSEKDKAKGMEVGADAYITKPKFDQTVLLDTLKRLV